MNEKYIDIPTFTIITSRPANWTIKEYRQVLKEQKKALRTRLKGVMVRLSAELIANTPMLKKGPEKSYTRRSYRPYIKSVEGSLPLIRISK